VGIGEKKKGGEGEDLRREPKKREILTGEKKGKIPKREPKGNYRQGRSRGQEEKRGEPGKKWRKKAREEKG